MKTVVFWGVVCVALSTAGPATAGYVVQAEFKGPTERYPHNIITTVARIKEKGREALASHPFLLRQITFDSTGQSKNRFEQTAHF